MVQSLKNLVFRGFCDVLWRKQSISTISCKVVNCSESVNGNFSAFVRLSD